MNITGNIEINTNTKTNGNANIAAIFLLIYL